MIYLTGRGSDRILFKEQEDGCRKNKNQTNGKEKENHEEFNYGSMKQLEIYTIVWDHLEGMSPKCRACQKGRLNQSIAPE